MSRKTKIYIIGGILSAIVLAIGCFLIFKMVSTESIVMVLLIIVGGGAFFLLSFYGNGLEGQDRMLVDYQMKRMRDEFSKYSASNGPSNEVIQDILRRISELEKKIFSQAVQTQTSVPQANLWNDKLNNDNEETEKLWRIIELIAILSKNINNSSDRDRELFAYAISQLSSGRHRLKDTLNFLERKVEKIKASEEILTPSHNEQQKDNSRDF